MSRSPSFSPPSIGKEEILEVVNVLRSGWLTTGPKAILFENRFRKFVGAKKALALNSGTSALHLALSVLKIRPGDLVLTTPMTFCSGLHVIEHMGARPVLVDVESDTLNIDPEGLQKYLSRIRSKRIPKAIIPVHYAGHPCEMDAISELADKYHLGVIEDAAHALPAKYKGKVIGGISDLTAFSFYATKNLTTAEGGMLTGSARLIDEARIMSLHGMSRHAWNRYGKGTWFYEVTAAGFKYNLTDLQAALGLAQLQKLPYFHRQRKAIAQKYLRGFRDLDEIQVPVEKPYAEHAWHLFPIRLYLEQLKISREEFIRQLAARNISSSVHFIPNHLQPFYRKKYGYKPKDFPVAFREYQRLISLPLYPGLSDRGVHAIIKAVREIVKKYSKKKYA